MDLRDNLSNHSKTIYTQYKIGFDAFQNILHANAAILDSSDLAMEPQ